MKQWDNLSLKQTNPIQNSSHRVRKLWISSTLIPELVQKSNPECGTFENPYWWKRPSFQNPRLCECWNWSCHFGLYTHCLRVRVKTRPRSSLALLTSCLWFSMNLESRMVTSGFYRLYTNTFVSDASEMRIPTVGPWKWLA